MDSIDAADILRTPSLGEPLRGFDSDVVRVGDYAVKRYIRHQDVTPPQLALYQQAMNYIHESLTARPASIDIGGTEVWVDVNPIVWVGKDKEGTSVAISPWIEGENLQDNSKQLHALPATKDREWEANTFYTKFSDIIDDISQSGGFKGIRVVPMNVKIITSSNGRRTAVLTDASVVSNVRKRLDNV